MNENKLATVNNHYYGRLCFIYPSPKNCNPPFFLMKSKKKKKSHKILPRCNFAAVKFKLYNK